MSDEARRTLIACDFNASNLAAYLTHDEERPQLVATASAYSGNLAAAPQAGPVEASWDAAVVWTRPECVSLSFAAFAETGEPRLAAALAEVDDFAETLMRLRDQCGCVIVSSWQAPRVSQLVGGLAMREGFGLTNTVMRMNLRLAERVDGMPGITVLDSTRWFACEHEGLDARLWYGAKVPYRNEVFRRATRDIKSVMRAARGESRKLIVVDLDETLWGGVVGEVGWQGIRLGGHDPTGEAFVDFQRLLKALARRGVLLAIASKNDEEVALAAIDEHPEMVLRASDFVARRINWGDKAENVAAIARQLNLGLASVVFIDDNPVERARVREALPDVLVPEWPARPLQYVDALLTLRCFDAVTLTTEDLRRSGLYAAEAARNALRLPGEGPEAWLTRLGVRVQVEELSETNLPRALQLLNKTNQMNLSTRRLEASALQRWLQEGTRVLWTFRVSDRFGDSGLTGLASVEVDGRAAVLVDFVLSCRVFGRRIEEAMLHHVTQYAAERGATELSARFKATERNGPCLRFLEASGMRHAEDQVFRWTLSEPYPLPPALELVRQRSEVAA